MSLRIHIVITCVCPMSKKSNDIACSIPQSTIWSRTMELASVFQNRCCPTFIYLMEEVWSKLVCSILQFVLPRKFGGIVSVS